MPAGESAGGEILATASPSRPLGRGRRLRPYRRRPVGHRVSSAMSGNPNARMRTAPVAIGADRRRAMDADRDRRLERVARHLVRTMNACPAPGIAPLRTRDWMLIGVAVVAPYALVAGLALLAGH